MVDAWNERWGIDGVLTLEDGEGGLPRIRMQNRFGCAELYLHGAHLTHWQPRDQEPVLWLSPRSRFGPDDAIRGGVPLCWPWFGDHPERPDLPAHGFARRRAFSTVAASQEADGTVRVKLEYSTGESDRALWPHPARIEATVRLGAALEADLEMTNLGDAACTFTAALHTYLRVGAVDQVLVHGLEGIDYLDKPDGFAQKTQGADFRIRGEVDRVFVATAADVVVEDPLLGRRLRIGKTGSRSTVVWNPGPDRSVAMTDMGAEAFRTMLCVEAANTAADPVSLQPGQSHVLGTRLAVWPG